MTVVLDASAAMVAALGRARAEQFTRILETADEVMAPDLLVAEVVNTIWKYHQFEHLPLDICDRSLAVAIGLVDRLIPCRDLYREAFLLARTARGPAYDMFYLALARREDACFLTDDRALRKEAERQGIRLA